MWRLLRAEFDYNKFVVLAIFIVTAGLWSLYLVDPAGIFTVFGLPAILPMAVLLNRWGKERRLHFHTLLPLSLKQIGSMHVVLFVAYFEVAMVLSWSIQFLVDRDTLANDFIPLWELLTVNGILIGVVTLSLIQRDLKSHKAWQFFFWALWTVLFSLAVLATITHTVVIDSGLRDNSLMAFYVLLANSYWVGLLIIRMNTFARRKSFLA